MKPARRLCIPWPAWVAEGSTKSHLRAFYLCITEGGTKSHPKALCRPRRSQGFPGSRGEGGWVLREISRPLSIIFVVAGAVLPWWWVVAEVVVAILTRCDYTRAPAVSRVAGRTHGVSPPSTMEGRSFGHLELTIRIYNEYTTFVWPDGNNCIDPPQQSQNRSDSHERAFFPESTHIKAAT